MDARELQQSGQPHHQQPRPPHHQLQSSPMLMGHAYHANNRNPNAIINPNSTTNSLMSPHPATATSTSSPGGARLSFGSLGPQDPKGLDSLGAIGFDGSPSAAQSFGVEPVKKKRGRPRKYAPDGNIALGLSPTTPLPADTSGAGGHASGGGGAGTNAATSDPPAKRSRGRPPGSGKKQLDALGGTGGVGFTPHVITVKSGEDIAEKIMAFSQQGPRTICILSASGAICSVTLKQQSTSGGNVTYEGRYEIISLSGSFFPPENGDNRDRNGSLSVSLAGSDGRVVGGAVTGVLMAASPVQVIVGSFVVGVKKQKSKSSSVPNSEPSSAPQPPAITFGGPITPGSPRSHGGGTSESSEENDSSPAMNRGPTLYGNPGQPLHAMQMYQLWSAQNPQ